MGGQGQGWLCQHPGASQAVPPRWCQSRVCRPVLRSCCHHRATPAPSCSARRCSPHMAGTDGEAPAAQVPQCRHSRGLTVLLWRSHQALSHPTTYVPSPPVAGAGFCTGDTWLQSQSHHSCLPVHGARKTPALSGPPVPAAVPATRTSSRGAILSHPLAAFMTYGHPVPPRPGTICYWGAVRLLPALSPRLHTDPASPGLSQHRPAAGHKVTQLSPALAPAVSQFPHCWGRGGCWGSR